MSLIEETGGANVPNGAALTGSILGGTGDDPPSGDNGNDIRSATATIQSLIRAGLAWPPICKVKAWWPSLSLVRQFTLASSAMVLVGLGVLDLWVSKKIEEGIKRHAAARTALYMESFLAPHLQELSSRQQLSDDNARTIDLLLAKDATRTRVVAAKVWNSRRHRHIRNQQRACWPAVSGDRSADEGVGGVH